MEKSIDRIVNHLLIRPNDKLRSIDLLLRPNEIFFFTFLRCRNLNLMNNNIYIPQNFNYIENLQIFKFWWFHQYR